jgi:hypothetical protein
MVTVQLQAALGASTAVQFQIALKVALQYQAILPYSSEVGPLRCSNFLLCFCRDLEALAADNIILLEMFPVLLAVAVFSFMAVACLYQRISTSALTSGLLVVSCSALVVDLTSAWSLDSPFDAFSTSLKSS